MSFRVTPENTPDVIRRALAPAAFAASLLLAAPGAHAQGAPATTAAPVDHVVLLSTSDVKGKTLPCGCSIPKGGLSRRAGFADSLRKVHPNLLIVDSGGFFPDAQSERDDAPFMTEAMRDLGLAGVGLGDRELMFGRSFLLAALERSPVPVVCANLWEKAGKQPRRTLVRPWVVQKVGKQKVGLFGLINASAALGPSADSLEVSDPAEAARQAIAELRKQGANVIVLLSSLGRVETEDLVLAAPGIDVAIAGRNVPLLQRSREIDNTTVVFGGEQGQYVGLTELGLDAKGRIVSRKSGAWMLGPDVADQPAMLAKVTAFEERPEVKARRAPPKPAAGAAAGHDDHAGHSH
jgi:2',3'-cyclic-nucleotide 2'-phosphodiesterase (5'-nucleotidase family)